MKLVLFSVSYAGLWGQDRLTLEAFIPRARALGYQGVEIMGKRPHAFPADVSRARLRRLRNLLTENGLEMACMAAYTNFTAGSESREVPLVDIQAEYVGQLARLTHELGGNLVRVFTGYDVPGADAKAQWDACVRGVRACADLATRHDVRIGVQNHHGIAVESRGLAEFIAEVDRPSVCVMLDAWSPALRGEDLAAAARLLAPRTAYTTIADYVRIPRYRYHPDLVNYEPAGPDLVRAVPMGDGVIDYPSFLGALLEGGYTGPAAYEMCSPLRGGGSLENLDTCAARFVTYMRQHGFAD